MNAAIAMARSQRPETGSGQPTDRGIAAAVTAAPSAA